MSECPTDLKYASTHEWIRHEGDGIFTFGITDHAQDLLGDIVYVEMPDTDSTISTGDEVGVVESVKAASDIYTPITGTVIEINETLEDAPETINNDPYGDGWIMKIKAEDPQEADGLLDAEGYQATIEEDD